MKFHIIKTEEGLYRTEPRNPLQKIKWLITGKLHKEANRIRTFPTKQEALEHIKNLHTRAYEKQ